MVFRVQRIFVPDGSGFSKDKTLSPAAQPIALPAPVNTLPSSVSSAVNPTSTQSPASSSLPIINPITITAPNQVAPPITGTNSASSVVAPVGSVPVGNPVAVKPPASAVKPVSSSAPPRVIKVFDFWGPEGNICSTVKTTGELESCTKARDLQDERERLEAQARAGNSDAQKKLANNLISEAKLYAYHRVGPQAAADIEVYRAYITENFDPASQVGMAATLSLWMQTGAPSEIRWRLQQTVPELRKYVNQMREVRKYDAGVRAGTIRYDPNDYGRLRSGIDGGKAQLAFMLGTGLIDNWDAFGNVDPFSWLDIFDIIGVFSVVFSLAKLGGKALANGLRSILRNGAKVGGRAIGETTFGRAVAKAEARAARCFGNSFTANTKVWVARAANDLTSKAKVTLEKTKTLAKTALTAVAISSIGVGTQVLAHNEQTKLETPQIVTATHEHIDPIIVTLKLETSDKKLETVQTTPEHPFFALLEPSKTANGVWVNAGELENGNWLKRANGETGIVRSVSFEVKSQKMYNLTVARDHTYFVGDGQWLVHNCPEFYHGTSVQSAGRLLRGAELDTAVASALKADGAAGFYLGTSSDSAWFYYAARRDGTVLTYNLSDEAYAALTASGARLQNIPVGARSAPGASLGQEFFIPPEAFALFNQLVKSGQITIRAAPLPK